MIVGIVKLKDIATFVARPDDPRELDDGLFADNVRGILGHRNDVNRAISRTIVSPDGAEFVFRNSGITMLQNKFFIKPAAISRWKWWHLKL
jgi:hypothetical protein